MESSEYCPQVHNNSYLLAPISQALLCCADTATRLGSTADTDDEESTRGFSSPKPPTKSVSWASSVTSSSGDQEIVFLRTELKEAMKENLE